MISVEKVKREEGRRRIDKGDASALLIIPKDFTAALLEGKGREASTDPQSGAAHSSRDDRRSAFHADRRRVLSADRWRATSFAHAARGTPSDASIAQISVQFNHVIDEHAQVSCRRPLIQLDTKVIQQKTDKPGGFAALMLPGMLYMAVFFHRGRARHGCLARANLRRTAARRHYARQFSARSWPASCWRRCWCSRWWARSAWLWHISWSDLPIANFPLAVLWIAALRLRTLSLHDAAAVARFHRARGEHARQLRSAAAHHAGRKLLSVRPDAERLCADRTADAEWLVRYCNCRRSWTVRGDAGRIRRSDSVCGCGWLVVGWRIRRTVC